MDKLLRLFIFTAGGLVLASGLVHLLNATGTAQILSLPDLLLGIPLRYALLMVGTLELAVAALCLFGKRSTLQVTWLAWLATNLLVYRLGLVFTGCKLHASCIGYPTDPLHLSRAAADLALDASTGFLVLGSYAAALWLWQAGKAALPRSHAKMSCPACGVHIEFATRNLGQKIPCPHCQATVTLRKPALLKMPCFFCKEHIEFPAHALGTKLACPHCKMDITLKEPA